MDGNKDVRIRLPLRSIFLYVLQIYVPVLLWKKTNELFLFSHSSNKKDRSVKLRHSTRNVLKVGGAWRTWERVLDTSFIPMPAQDKT